MASFLRLQQDKSSRLLADVFAALNAAERARPREEHAARVLQAAVRMWQQRWRFHVTRVAAVKIQKTYRGYRGRLVALDRSLQREKLRQAAFFTHFAVLIQRRWRGYFSRKWRSNFYEMKGYLREVVQRSNQVRDIAEQYRYEAIQDLENSRQAALRREFDQVAHSLHHLVSTAAIPGVFRDPATGMAQQTVFGQSVEDALRAQPVLRRKVTKELPKKAAALRGSLQATGSFETVRDTRRLEAKLERETRYAEQEFRVTKADQIGAFVPGHNVAPYVPPAKFRVTEKAKNIAPQSFRSAVHPEEMFEDQGLPPLSKTTTLRVS